MDIIATQKYVRVSPKKMRVVADATKILTPLEAVEKLPFLHKRGSEIIVKVVKSALANAKQKGVIDDSLIFKEIQIGEGPRLKRGMAASRGRWHPYKKRMSHIRVVLTSKLVKVDDRGKSEGNTKKVKEDKTDTKKEGGKLGIKSKLKKVLPKKAKRQE
ncbi:MAG: 50S ribosomal protein L22 [Candidatus Woesebacteria bacterium GW2011_GWA1_39_21]|uniref:Large ribosomal subunit protein uL22 n=1 Tax=Candidatus Woesebacteria bacterium GW2011_GWA1_39_21 TaxID=1618550 RepID=A0A0G0NFH5_9BACT|nr:MAG: 50S ribosomal protein L22 [Candidatus Woesebacteria bacterium GW2011_GWA1_39_21]